MSLFRKKPESRDNNEPTMVSVSVAQLKRQFLYDMGLAGHEDVVTGAGVTLVSDEVDEMEQRASDARLAEVHAIHPIITRYADLAADVMLAASFADKNKDDIDPIQAEFTRDIFRTVSNASITCFLSSFIDLDLLHGHYAPHEHENADE